MSVQSRAFLRLFREEAQKGFTDPKEFFRLWESPADWTAFMLGSSSTRNGPGKNFGVIGRIGSNLGYQVQAEYLRVDQIWYVYDQEDQQDWRIEGFVEHENNPKRLAQTLRKILELGPGFKVVITYPLTPSGQALLDETSALIQRRYGTPPDSRVTIIFGFLEELKSTVRWEAHEFDGLGRISGIEFNGGANQ